MTGGELILTAALTGPIATKADNPHLPTTPEEIAASAEEAAAAGAAIVHVHLRDDRGRPTGDLEVARRTVGLIEQRCDALVQLSTGVGMGVPFAERERLIEARPRMATLNVASMTFGPAEFSNPPEGVRRLAARMRELDVKPELEVYDTGHIDLALALRAEGLLADPLQFSIVTGVPGGMPPDPALLLAAVARLPADAIWQVIGIGRHHRTMSGVGMAVGGNARTGLEDTLHVRRGELATSNGQLVERMAALASALDRPLAAPAGAAERLGLPGR